MFNKLPNIAELPKCLEVVYVGSKEEWNIIIGEKNSEARDRFNKKFGNTFSIDSKKLYKWLNFLIEVHPLYKNIVLMPEKEFEDHVSKLEENMLERVKIINGERVKSAEKISVSNVAQINDAPDRGQSVWVGEIPSKVLSVSNVLQSVVDSIEKVSN